MKFYFKKCDLFMNNNTIKAYVIAEYRGIIKLKIS